MTGLTVRKDLTLWVLAVGGAIFMIGVIQGMYWQASKNLAALTGRCSYGSGAYQ
nr:hypothetical protein P5656_04105 [Bacillus subtilis]